MRRGKRKGWSLQKKQRHDVATRTHEEINGILTEMYKRFQITPAEWWIFFRNVCGRLLGVLFTQIGAKATLKVWREVLEAEQQSYLAHDKAYEEARDAMNPKPVHREEKSA